MRAVLIFSWLAALCVADYTYINCYQSLPSSFSVGDVYDFQSSSHCYSVCSEKNSNYFALTNHSTCYCGSSNPSGTESTSSSCNAYCLGYGSEMCGGENAFSVYTMGGGSSSNWQLSSSGSASLSQSSSGGLSSGRSSSSQSTTSSSVGSTSSTAGSGSSTTAAGPSTTGSSSSSDPKVVYSTSVQTQGGSTVYVTASMAQSTPTGDERGSSSKKKSSPRNIGAIVGGVVGGVCGALAVAALILLLVRRINRKREHDRMEKEYREAIKPVDFDEALYRSSTSSHKGKNPFDKDPFDDARRISNGSLAESTTLETAQAPNVLTVANPDE
ncbi:LAMI_0E01398g1_1 [Lachancea mirantina]|uniref:LAMI_0E01398g1_1 n=1 Tax=Lachancea mirantina TaxID=1230905 RepID=A0A1G4JIW7_9SACH|nr:LAMI_0E01398g1_1 [Lachancea mirantina]